jgi:hypothetical protein
MSLVFIVNMGSPNQPSRDHGVLASGLLPPQAVGNGDPTFPQDILVLYLCVLWDPEAFWWTCVEDPCRLLSGFGIWNLTFADPIATTARCCQA